MQGEKGEAGFNRASHDGCGFGFETIDFPSRQKKAYMAIGRNSGILKASASPALHE